MSNDSLKKLMLADLVRSGLSDRDAKGLRCAPLSAIECGKLTGHKAAGYRLPYFDLKGKALPFYRVRFFDPPVPFGAKKPQRYWQPPNTLPAFYLPPTLDWGAIAKNPELPLLITEGEKKAAAGCLNELATIGLGGVWSWRSKKSQLVAIPDFDAFEWRQRTVLIVFDSDANEKEGVQQAMRMLALHLIKLGAFPYALKLPSSDPSIKVGLDDYLLANGPAKLRELPQSPLAGLLADALWQMNNELAYVKNSHAVYQFETGALLKQDALCKMAYANRIVTEFNDRGQAVEKNVAGAWLKWQHRRTHRNLVYAPGEEAITEANDINLWKGWGIEPAKGDITPWAELIEFMFKGSPQHKRWFLQWCAYPLQYPGTKLYSAVVFFSLGHGVGKSLIGLTLGKIYGDNFSAITEEHLQGGFNDWSVNKQFVLGDDVTGSDKRREADKLKVMITREQVTIDIKYQPKYDVEDRINYLFTSNRPDAFLLDNQDRRYFIMEIEGAPLPEEFYKKYDRWYRDPAGPAALFYHLKTNIDVKDFNPRAPAPITEAKREMIELSRSDLDAWVDQIVHDPESALRLDGVPIRRDLWTVQELRALYDPDGRQRTTMIALSKSLRRAGLKPLPTTLRDGTPKKLWPVRNVEKWKEAPHYERVKHYEEAHKRTEPKEAKY